MFGIILTFISAFFVEISSSIGKKQVAAKTVSIYTVGFLNMLSGSLIFWFIILFIQRQFIFSLSSLPWFLLRATLEVGLAHFTILAITKADRSTFGFLRILTIPLLLAADIALGYSVSYQQVIGISLIVVSLIFLFVNHGIRKAGAIYVLITAITAVATLSLLKYNITNFNSVEAEQALLSTIIGIYFLIMALVVAKENPFKFLRQPIFLIQSLAEGSAFVVLSFAYLFAPASVITAAKRSGGVMWSATSGKLYFKEKKFLIKLVAFGLISTGLVLLTF